MLLLSEMDIDPAYSLMNLVRFGRQVKDEITLDSKITKDLIDVRKPVYGLLPGERN